MTLWDKIAIGAVILGVCAIMTAPFVGIYVDARMGTCMLHVCPPR